MSKELNGLCLATSRDVRSKNLLYNFLHSKNKETNSHTIRRLLHTICKDIC